MKFSTLYSLCLKTGQEKLVREWSWGHPNNKGSYKFESQACKTCAPLQPAATVHPTLIYNQDDIISKQQSTTNSVARLLLLLPEDVVKLARPQDEHAHRHWHSILS
jgi:hypothetical protein